MQRSKTHLYAITKPVKSTALVDTGRVLTKKTRENTRILRISIAINFFSTHQVPNSPRCRRGRRGRRTSTWARARARARAEPSAAPRVVGAPGRVVLVLLLLDELERQPRRPRVARFDRRHLYRNAVAHAHEIAVAVAAQHHSTGACRADVDVKHRTRGASIRRPGTAGRLQDVL